MTATLSPAVARPAHVPEAAVYDFDMFADPAYVADPHARVLDLLGKAPGVFWTPRNGGHWMLLSHEAIFNAARDVETFSSELMPLDKVEQMQKMMPRHVPLPLPICVDPPAHMKYRGPLNRVFGPKAINDLKDSIRTLAGELVDAIRPQGACDFMSAVAEPLPVQVFLKMLGLPVARMDDYRALVRAHLSDPTPNPMDSVKKLWRIVDTIKDVLEDRRANPQDDIISLLWQLDIDGKPTTMDDMENYCVVLFVAGLDTVMNGMGHGIRHLAQHPELQQELRANPALIGDATEELLRRYTFTVPPRIIGKDTVFAGLEMKRGERAMLFLPAADLDPKAFSHAERFDLKRENKTHIAFNAGPHRCLGSHLARVELQIVYEEMLKRLPLFRLDPAHPPSFHCGHVVGVDTLHLLWNP
ncbi:Cytochrome P450 [Solimonas aquatica]|uniref:Cytochrome P450 n=1 Tax=Solimonas aquatica TaxID=489703 RepID=A0A1H9MGZ3_9GAMM|nr:cytochrome P450 [Solimonas aquatica]SER22789.1 Cytochrome P450 [Solimonas aquatica]